MATAANNPTQMKPRRQMEEIKAPELFQFKKTGDLIAGVLLQIEPKGIGDKVVQEYTMRLENGMMITFLATNDLAKKLRGEHVGHYCEVRYESDDSSFQKQNQSAMKVFKVLVAKEKEPGF